MTKRDELLALAERCEKATEGSRELDAAIEAAYKRCGDCDVMFKVKNPHLNQFVPDERGAVSFYAVDDDGKAHLLARRAAPHYTTSLDAAMTLVPEGAVWDVASTGASWIDVPGSPTLFSAKAATPALALCASALRAACTPPWYRRDTRATAGGSLRYSARCSGAATSAQRSSAR